ncbi:MAG: HAMP domain-containing histidine kinase [Tepidanaerobacter acetatoxydans]|uniref:sensor histidine kinase n=1 Tax=Tepidanaerobacter TaxID=499228 RepID=UPI000A64282E|nr:MULTISPECIES: HAMP domain-containing sensor histidine kinase [Tepidanaerobacter]NLU09886.1 HAMP domain-containing histidine kinase [Tepidanaerobacter acetatoxydans]
MTVTNFKWGKIVWDLKRIVLGIFLVILGVMAPYIINVYNFGIYDLLASSIREQDKNDLIIAAFKLVILNSIRCLPHYIGTFIISESIAVYLKDKILSFINSGIVLIIIPTVYHMINHVHGIHYDLGIPALIVVIIMISLKKLDLKTVSTFKKTIVIVLVLMGVQWMDIIPELSTFQFGRGETSQDIKKAAEFIGCSDVLTMTSVMFFAIFTSCALLIVKLISDEHKLIITMDKNKQIERELSKTRFEALQARNYMELKNLVHDLKTPLTSMQALVSVIELMEENPKKLSYLKRIENSIDRLSNMISEILYEDKKNSVTIEELMEFTFSQISPFPYASKIKYINKAKSSKVNINKIGICRAVINALDNAYDAIDKKDGNIWIEVYNSDNKVYIDIIDDGIGIDEKNMKVVWERGFSTKKSTGFGLGLIKETMEKHQGKVEIISMPQKGTCISLVLPEVIGQ